MALTSSCTFESNSVLPFEVLNCSTWYWLPVYQFCSVALSAVPMMLTSRSLPTLRNQIWSDRHARQELHHIGVARRWRRSPGPALHRSLCQASRCRCHHRRSVCRCRTHLRERHCLGNRPAHRCRNPLEADRHRLRQSVGRCRSHPAVRRHRHLRTKRHRRHRHRAHHCHPPRGVCRFRLRPSTHRQAHSPQKYRARPSRPARGP